jgi:hypothetical protein
METAEEYSVKLYRLTYSFATLPTVQPYTKTLLRSRSLGELDTETLDFIAYHRLYDGGLAIRPVARDDGSSSIAIWRAQHGGG